MNVIHARNANQALPELMYALKTSGVKRDSRNGPVLRLPGPTTILYEKPMERVVFWAQRDANPFFHLLEALWMLSGREDVAFPASIVDNMRSFSDDGVVFNGAYGYRWRNHFGIDQIKLIATALRKNPDCRRQVLSMWDGYRDPGLVSRDLPCNTHAYFAVNDGALDMTVCNRSNDAVWGALGANCVHFSMLQEVMAVWIGVPVGRYWQISNNMHLYLDHHRELMEEMAAMAFPSQQYKNCCPYGEGLVTPTPLIPSKNVDQFLRDVAAFIDYEGVMIGMRDRFVRTVANPMLQALSLYKRNSSPEKFSIAGEALDPMRDGFDWSLAARSWINRREEKWRIKHV